MLRSSCPPSTSNRDAGLIVPSIKIMVMAAGLLLASCAGQRASTGSASVVATRLTELPAPARADLSSAARPYLIGPYDRLTIEVFGAPELSREVQADASGRIAMPLTGIIEASGKTPEDLASLIRSKLIARYVRDPQVTVNLKETLSQVVTIDGEVREPGLYPVIGRMTLMKAVATAKGLGEFARLEDVVIFRSVNGQKMLGVYNLKAIREGRYDDPEVFANDIVLVGDSAGRRLVKNLLLSVPAFLTPLVYLLR